MIARWAVAVVRASLVPMLVRVALALAGTGALLLAAPAAVWALPVALWLLPALAVVPAVAPGGRAPGVLIVLAAAGWLSGSGELGGAAGAAPGLASGALGELVLLASLLYLVHALAALAAALPYDAVVAPEVLLRWLLRLVLVLAAAALLTGLLLAGLPRLATWAGLTGAGHVGATLAGLALALALVVALRVLLNRGARAASRGPSPVARPSR